MSDCRLPLAEAVAGARGWDNVTRQIMLAGKTLRQPDNKWLDPSFQVSGCQSQVYVWQTCDDKTENSQFAAWSDAKIIRGVLAIVLEKANELTVTEVSSFDFATYLHNAGVIRHLSQSRADGIGAVICRLQELASLATSPLR